jgi:prepilin-type N-terminal cleavage/methylation domain-containing protein
MVNRRAFTLIELLAVIAIMAIVGVITVVSYLSIIGDVRRASAVEQVKGLLSQARTISIRSGASTLLTFRARRVNGEARMEAIIAQPAGDSDEWISPQADVPDIYQRVRMSRFLPVEGVDPVLLPVGIEVAVPGHALSNPVGIGGGGSLPYSGDLQYLPPTHLGDRAEAIGVMPGIMFGRDGTTVVGVPEHQSRFAWVDLDRDGLQGMGGIDYNPALDEFAPGDGCFVLTRLDSGSGAATNYVEFSQVLPMCQGTELDEPWVVTGPFLAVYDSSEMRKLEASTAWLPNDEVSASKRSFAHTRFIDEFGRRLFFNRFTGISLEDAER